jgi:hypothetical protein
MGHLLKNKNLEIQIDFPLENYNFSRFDWTGKITGVKFKNISLSSVEDPNCQNEDFFGKGFYNEFGIDTALGFDDAEIGEWFHKIGVGVLKKEDSQYAFNKPYEIKPAKFQINVDEDSVLISCISTSVNGYSYELQKEIEIQETGFAIKYYLKNTGEKVIHTDEYVHNFIAMNKNFIGENYNLNFSFELKPEFFGEIVNTELAVIIGENRIQFNSPPNEQFFFSNLSGGKSVEAAWELINQKTKIGIRENANFQTNKVNLWGWKHVISPELFLDINIAPGESTEWIRNYEVFHV